MSLLESLTDFVRSNMPERAMDGFDSLMDEVRFVPAARDLGAGQYRLAIMQYTATLAWERFPYRICPPQLIMALLLSWYQNDGAAAMDAINVDWELPELDVEIIDNETAIVVVTAQMAEPLDLLEDADGAIPLDGQRWKLADATVWTAEQATLFFGSGNGTWPVQSEVS
ncbi:phage tail protein [Citrobacter sp. S39]|nr:phage tail protein [Citrobacter sp. S39]QFX90701.1 phage tail protein [Citrobacter sp. S39]HED1545426.1 phage tail protein [Citrobacter freundii]